ncbi:MAG TPA: alpha/beta hydrolase [Streptosporangiaceae bacterium]|nr:alpha/beta hydrolase [Streptosporangiaceae bacterium]
MRPALLAAAATALVALAGCTQGGGHPAASPGSGGDSRGTSGGQPLAVGRQRLDWHGCGTAGSRLRCAALQVPLDYARPGGRTITIALSEVPATAPPSRRLGILLVNPGGPGGSGLSLASFVAQGLDPAVAARYDIVGFDTRGVGSSVPALHCDPSFFADERPNYIPANAAAERVLQDRAKAYAADCEKKYGWLLPYMTTENIARDMDQIRAALGQSKLSYFGYSYGTYIGQVYATLFPHRIRRMVLDSTVDPTGVWWADNIAQDYAFQGRMNAFYAWLARYDRVYLLGATPAAARRSWYAAVARLAAHPIAKASGPRIGPDEFTDTFEVGGYDNAYWPALAAALASYLHGRSGQLVTLFDQVGEQDENEFAVYNAVECADAAWPRNWSVWNRVNRRVYRAAPFETWDNVWFNAACAYWPVHGPAKPLHIGAPGLPGILMLQGTLDAATPYAGAQNAHRLLPTARMVVVEGGGNHGQSLAYPPSTCVNGYLNRYLATGALPSRPGLVNATCPALPAPVPAG